MHSYKLTDFFAVYLQAVDTRSSTSYLPPVVPTVPPRIPIRLQHLHNKRRHIRNQLQLQQVSEDPHQATEVGGSLLTREGSFHLPSILPPNTVLRPLANNEVKDTAQLISLV